jgi:arabinose-5-phosphate isomerase
VLRAEADAVAAIAPLLDGRLTRAIDLIHHAQQADGAILVAGLGKSGLIGRKLSATLASLGIPAHDVHPSEAMHGDIGRIRQTDVLLALSLSGETQEVVALAGILKQDGVKIISITGGGEDDPARGVGALARIADVSLSVGCITEAADLALAPTCSTTATLALGDAIALAVARRLAVTADDFARRHPGGTLGGLLRPVTDLLRFRVGENLPLVDATQTVREALHGTAQLGRRPGALIVINAAAHGAIVGIFTDGDLRRLVTRGQHALDTPIADVMTRSPRTLPDTALVRDALAMVRQHRQDEVPIVDRDGKPLGLLDVQDLMAPRLVQ